MSTEETRSVVGEYVAALQRGDTGALRASFAPPYRPQLRTIGPAGVSIAERD
jgi:hypothetical protein